MPDDPDALWKPGYTGEYRTPERDPATDGARPGRSGRPGAVTVVATIVLVGIVAVGLGTGMLRSPTPESEAPALEQWSVTFDTTHIGAVAATDEVVIAVAGRPGQVVALDRRDGGERWRRPASGDSTTGLDVVAGAALTRHVDGDGRGSVIAHDSDTGEPLWSDALAVGERIDVFRDAVLRVTPDDAIRIDPRTGQRMELRAVGTGAGPSDNVVRAVAIDEPHLVELDDGTVTILLDGSTASVTLTFERS
ncbi:MAG: PQQ-binding-like beta-propeller repeat protein [Ilumatobacteraceae bacterium]